MDKLTRLVGIFEPQCTVCECGSEDVHCELETVRPHGKVPIWKCNDCQRTWMATR